MPLIYTAQCSACGHHQSAPEFYCALQSDDGTLTVLPHPGEMRTLEKAGYSWDKAEAEARLVGCRLYLCKRCGKLYERRSFSAPLGCTTGIMIFFGSVLLFIAFVAAVVLPSLRMEGKIPKTQGVWQLPATVFVVASVVFLLAIFLLELDRRTFVKNLPGRPPLTDQTCCGPWTASSHFSMGSAKGKFPCPSCGTMNVTVSCTGIS